MRYADRLNETPWLTVLGYAWAAFATLAMLQLVTPAHWHAPMRTLGLALPLLLFVAKDCAQLPDVLARLRALRGRRSRVADWLAACLPPGLVGWIRLERALWRGFFGWLRRQPQPARPAGMRFTYDAQGAYSTVIAIALFSVFVELPLDAAIVPLLLRDPAAARVVHICVALGCAYTLVWLLGDRWLVCVIYPCIWTVRSSCLASWRRDTWTGLKENTGITRGFRPHTSHCSLSVSERSRSSTSGRLSSTRPTDSVRPWRHW